MKKIMPLDLFYYLTDEQVNQLTLNQAQDVLDRINRYLSVYELSYFDSIESDEDDFKNLVQAVTDNVLSGQTDYNNLF